MCMWGWVSLCRFLASCLSCWTDLGESWENLGWGGGKEERQEGEEEGEGRREDEAVIRGQ